MTLVLKYAEKMQQGREQGIEEGIELGIEKHTLEVVQNMIGHNMSPEVIAIAINKPLSETMHLIEQVKGKGAGE